MALTAEQKEQRRLATNARNRAYNARYRELSAAENAGRVEINARFAHELQIADAVEKQIEAEQTAALDEIDREITKLQEKRQATNDDFKRRYCAARDMSSEIYGRKRAAEGELDKALAQQFPDLCGSARYNAACWKPIKNYL